MEVPNKHSVSVCVCTYKRQHLLVELLTALAEQKTDETFDYSVVVADNDAQRSSELVVRTFSEQAPIIVTYLLEPRKGIAAARNKALERATGDLIAFIDDDEVPERDWLLQLVRILNRFGVDGVLGPVKPRYDKRPPAWILKGGFFERPTHDDGYRIGLSEARTGNVLFRRELLAESKPTFDPRFANGGEDVEFFSRMLAAGRSFVWSKNAAVYELVPRSRANARYLVRLALLRGANAYQRTRNRLPRALTSLLALALYGAALPFLIIRGYHAFMKYLIKLCDHSGALLAIFGVVLVRSREP